MPRCLATTSSSQDISERTDDDEADRALSKEDLRRGAV